MSAQIPPRRNRQATRPAADENAARTFRTTRSKPAQAVSTSTSVVTNTTVNKDATASRTDTVASAAKRKREALGEVTNKNKSRQTGLKGDAGDSKDKAIPVKKPAPSTLTTVTGARIPLGERKPLQPATTRHVRGSSTTEKEGEVAQDGAEDAMTVDAQDQRPIRTSRRLITRTTTVATSTSTLRSQPSVTAHGQSRRLASTTSSKNAGSIAATSRTRTSLNRRSLASTQTNAPEESVEDPKPAHKKRRTSSVGPEGDIPLQDGGDEEARFALPAADVEPSVEPKEGESQGALKASWDDLDKEDADDPQMVSEYVAEIFQYLLKLELTSMPNPRYMENQGELAWRMRGILTDWLIQIHGRFRLLPETLFLTINIIDRFLSSRVVSLVKLQLVGITSLFIAAKYEEIMAPSVANFLACADGNYDEKNILEAEKYILRTLDWNMSYPNPIHFLRRASKADGYDLAVRTVAKYFVEIALLEHRLLVATPSATAAAAIWLARLVLDKEEWNPNLVHYSGYTEADIVPVARLMLNYVLKPTRHENFFKKYAARKFMKASVFVHSWARDRWEEGTVVDLAAELPELRRASQARRDAGQAAGQLAEDDCLVVY